MGESKEKEKKKLKKRLGVFSVFSICTGVAFSSFFLLPGIAAGMTGPSLPLAFFTAAVLMVPAILSISELSAAMPRSGGPYFFITRSFGPLLGIIGALGKFIQLLLKGSFAFVGFGIYLSLVFDFPVQTTAVFLIILFTIINLFGVGQTAKTEKILVIILLLILSYFLVSGTNEIFAQDLDIKDQFQPFFAFGLEGFLSVIAVVFISFGGVAQVASVAEEIKNPSHSLPKGMLLSLGIASFIYLAGTALMIGILSSQNLRGDETPAATVAANITALPLPVTVIIGAALAAFASTGNAAILASSRYPLALARDRLLWNKFGKLNSHGVPGYAVILSGAIAVGFVLLLNVKEIAKIASAFLLFVFLSICLALIIFRESKKEEYQPKYKSPFYPWMQILGCIAYLGLIFLSGGAAIAFIAAMFLLGILWFYFGIKQKPRFSAAIYFLFGRLSKKGSKSYLSEGINITAGRASLTSVVKNAIFIDLDEEVSFETAIQRAAESLRDRLGGKTEEIARGLKEEVRHWKNPERFDISVAPVLLKGIEQPEMILIRGKIKIEGKDIRGLIVLVDDENSSDRLLKLLSQLEISINHFDFSDAWEGAENLRQLQDSLIQDVRSLSVMIKDSGPTAKMKGQKIEDISLPKHSLIGAIYRDGKIQVPGNDEELKTGDELIIIAQGEALNAISEQFSESILK